MSVPDAMLPSATAADPETRQANHAWRMRMLETAAERGLDLLDEVRSRAQAQADDDDLGLTYSRISKAIRQSVMLHARFEEDFNKSAAQKAAEAAAELAAEAQRAASAETGRKAHQKRQVKRAVDLAMNLEVDAAEARGEALDYAALYVDLHERLDDYDDYSDFGRLPIGAVVENICRVMGLAFDPALWAEEAWAVAEMAEKLEGSPFATWCPSANDDEESDEEGPDEDEDDPYGLAEEDDEPPRRSSRAPPGL